MFLNEKLTRTGKIGSFLCLLGAVIIVLNSPEETMFDSVDEIRKAALSPGFLIWFIFVVVYAAVVIIKVVPKYGRRNMLVYISICSLVGSISVVACKALGIALKATFAGKNQFVYFSTYFIIVLVLTGVLLQLNYLNKALITFSTALVTPIYYVFFTTSTIVASALLFNEFAKSDGVKLTSSLSGFLVTFAGVYLLSMDQMDRQVSTRHQSVPFSVLPKDELEMEEKEG
jgi:hypothetical protein